MNAITLRVINVRFALAAKSLRNRSECPVSAIIDLPIFYASVAPLCLEPRRNLGVHSTFYPQGRYKSETLRQTEQGLPHYFDRAQLAPDQIGCGCQIAKVGRSVDD